MHLKYYTRFHLLLSVINVDKLIVPYIIGYTSEVFPSKHFQNLDSSYKTDLDLDIFDHFGREKAHIKMTYWEIFKAF